MVTSHHSTALLLALLCPSAINAISSCSCPLLVETECNACATECSWLENACQTNNASGEMAFAKWNGFMELAQTHVIQASGETRHAPKPIAEREAELLFTPTQEAQATLAPTPSPTRIIEHEWGLEQLGMYTIEVPANEIWASSFPIKPESNIIQDGSEYYIPADNSNVNINFDLEDNRLIQGVYFQSWYSTLIESIEVGIHGDDGMEGEDAEAGIPRLPDTEGPGWTWFQVPAVTGGYNSVKQIIIPKVPARYVQFRLRGGSRGGSNWGFRQMKISGLLDGNAPGTGDDDTIEDTPLDSVPYFPSSDAVVRVAGYAADGSLLGVFDMRSSEQQRPILEQALTTKDLGQYSDEAWSVTIPWNWMKEGTKLVVGTHDPTNGLLLHHLKLQGLKHWGLHVLTRTKLVIFGTPEEAASLDTNTVESTKVTSGMFNSMPTAELRWVDAQDLYLPYLIIRTSQGPVKVTSEQERRDALIAAGDEADMDDEPRWEILKQHFAFRHRLAHTGQGVAETEISCCGGSPYSAGTSIFQGWAQSASSTDDGNGVTTWSYDKMGYWGGWAAAAWTGWTGMRPGDECGNLLIHELGHSQTMHHFTSGSSVSRGIEDEYPNDGTNEEWHPWGYDTTTRRFRTWYKHDSETTPPAGKRDPMNGGESANDETCYPQYTGYHAAKSLNWGSSAAQLLQAGMGANVNDDGSYKYSQITKQYEPITMDTADSLVAKGASVALEIGVPVVTIFGTLGKKDEVCQIYPELRSRHGNTFKLPSPFESGHSSDKFEGAAFMVNIEFESETTESVLIAAQKFADGATELRFFSLTIPLSKKPNKIVLYRFDTESYPNLSETDSQKTPLYSRNIVVGAGSDHADGLPAVVKAGRSWRGASTDVDVSGICIDLEDCLRSASTVSWSQEELKDLSYSSPMSLAPQSLQVAEGSVFKVTMENQEEGTPQMVNVVLSRFSGDDGAPSPLLGASLPSPPKDRLAHGFRAWLPFELNSNLPGGTYKTAHSNRLKIVARHANGELFEEFFVSFDFKVYNKDLVNLSDGSEYTSEAFPVSKSSAYFLAEDPYGATAHKSVWWDGDGKNNELEVPLQSECISNGEGPVTAKIKALQRVCGSSWQYNAGRSAGNCTHSLVLTLLPEDADLDQNAFLSEHPGCLFYTHPAQPVIIHAHRWHNPNSGAVVGTLALEFEVQAPGDRVIDDGSASPSASPVGSLSVSPSGSPMEARSESPSTSPSKSPVASPSASPSKSPVASPSASPSRSPVASPSVSPSKSPVASPSAQPSRSPIASPSTSPSSSPMAAPIPIEHVWGLEKHASYDVALTGSQTTWADSYPRDKSRLMAPDSEYYLSTSNPDANINFDFGANQDVNGVYLQSWYVTALTSIEVGVHSDDQAAFSRSTPVAVPSDTSEGWTWFTVDKIGGCCNKKRTVTIPRQYMDDTRYVQIRLRGATSSYANRWGLRQVMISGELTNALAPTASPTLSPTANPSATPTTTPTSSPTAAPTPSPTPNPTTTPTSNPTAFEHVWGMEQLAASGAAGLSLALADPVNMAWPDSSYPRDTSRLLATGSEYYIPNATPDVNLNFDFGQNQEIHGAFIKSWYVTDILSIQVGVHADDGTAFDAAADVVAPADDSADWVWYDLDKITGCCNKERKVNIPPTTQARYVQFRLREGYSYVGYEWGLREVRISGDLDAATASI